jgi:putative solute:sodium symporter small subunit
MPHTKSHPNAQKYWRKNLWIVAVLLTIWFVVSFPLAIVWAEPLNQFRLGGFPLGFWIAQQGSIIVFVLLVLAYAVILCWLDRHYKVND